MMELPARAFITGEPRDYFLRGVEIALTKKRMKKIALLRISVKTDQYGRETIYSVWGRPERKPMAIYSQSPVNAMKFTTEDWLQIGRMIGAQMENWVDNDVEFDRSETKAQAIHFDVWETTEYWDRTQDLFDVLEHDLMLHMSGKFHWRVRKALAELIEAMLVDSNTAIANALADPSQLDALTVIARRAGYDLVQAATPPVKKKAVAVELA